MSAEVIEVLKRSLDIGDYLHYYTHRTRCVNCGEGQYCYVRKGRELNGLDIACTNCGCTINLRGAFS